MGNLLSLKEILHEGRLVRGKALTAAEKIEERVSVLEEKWREFFGCLDNWYSRRSPGIRTSRTMIEQNGRKGTGARWLPEKGFEVKVAAGEMPASSLTSSSP